MNIPAFEVPITQPPPSLTEAQKAEYKQSIKQLLKEQGAVLIAHYYVDANIQALAEETQGFVGDSLAMAQFGHEHSASTLIVAGVKFMGETAKILNPEKRVLMPTLEANCSLDLGCPADQFKMFCEQHPNRTVVVYANTSAAVKALSDWVVTSSNALAIVRHLDAQGEKILWAPDRYLGHYIQKQTGADMVLWQGACAVHEEYKTRGIIELKKQYPNAAILVHPESPAAVIELADVVGSTSTLIQAAKQLPNKELIVATDRGIFYKMQQMAPDKLLLEAPTGGHGATCRSCGHCPWMAMNSLINLEQTLLEDKNEIQIPLDLCQRAAIPLRRMVSF